MTLKTFIDIAGWSAAVLILGAYGLLSFGKIQPRSVLYQWMNILGALGFIINCSWNGDEFSWNFRPSFIIKRCSSSYMECAFCCSRWNYNSSDV